MASKAKLAKILGQVKRCSKCKELNRNPLKGDQFARRFGFPPASTYRFMMIGPEPGSGPKRWMPPEEYMDRFFNDSKNVIKRLFDAFEDQGIDKKKIFFTNATKCRARGDGQSIACFESHCNAYLDGQIRAIKPKLIIVLGRGNKHLGLPKPKKGEVLKGHYNRIQCISATHPARQSNVYLQKVAKAVKAICK